MYTDCDTDVKSILELILLRVAEIDVKNYGHEFQSDSVVNERGNNILLKKTTHGSDIMDARQYSASDINCTSRTCTEDSKFNPFDEKTFNKKQNIAGNELSHSVSKEFSCDICDKKFTQKNKLEEHSSLHTECKQFPPDESEGKFYPNSNPAERCLINGREQLFSCPLCNKQFSRKCTWVSHMRAHESEKKSACKAPPKVIANGNKKQLIHPDRKRFLCGVCGKGYSKQARCNFHISTAHTVDGFFQCFRCPEKFDKVSEMKKHLITKGKDKAFVCEVCHKAFSPKCLFEAHCLKHAGKRFECEMCHKVFTRSDVLRIHVRSHTGERPYVCHICPKGFVQRGDLNAHIRTHTGEKAFACEACDKKFAHRLTLKRHFYSVHSTVKPFVCQVCQKGFAMKYYLNLHMRLHDGNNAFRCEFCPKFFVRRQVWVVHQRMHTGERPHACEVCQKRFVGRSELYNHLRSHSDEKRFSCQVCPKKYKLKRSLIKHSLEHSVHSGSEPVIKD